MNERMNRFSFFFINIFFCFLLLTKKISDLKNAQMSFSNTHTNKAWKEVFVETVVQVGGKTQSLPCSPEISASPVGLLKCYV